MLIVLTVLLLNWKSTQERCKHCALAGCSKVWTLPAVTNLQTGPIKIRCATAS